MHSIVKELTLVHNKEQLVQASPRLRKHFKELVALMIKARKLQTGNPELSLVRDENRLQSEQLREELMRIYRFEGGRQLIEAAQKDALELLDIWDKKQRS